LRPVRWNNLRPARNPRTVIFKEAQRQTLSPHPIHHCGLRGHLHLERREAMVTQVVEASAGLLPNVPDNPTGTSPGQLCACGKNIAILGLPIGSIFPRWCYDCPTKPKNAIKRCECQRKKARYGISGQDVTMAQWCADCPNKPAEAVNLDEEAASQAKARFSASLPQGGGMCACGKNVASMALPFRATEAEARWCPECPTRPQNAIPFAGRCPCGRRKATMGLPDAGPEGARWCPHCPDLPEGSIELVKIPSPPEPKPRKRSAAPSAPPLSASENSRCRFPAAAATEPVTCVCGKAVATLALPIQLWLPRWCPECPHRPRNCIEAALRCECGRRRKTLGLPGQPPKWCIHCPNIPDSLKPTSLSVPGQVDTASTSEADSRKLPRIDTTP